MKNQYCLPKIPEQLFCRTRIKALINDALASSHILFICGYFGSGKSMAIICYFYEKRDEVCWIDAKETENVIPVIKEILDAKEKVHYFVIDNVHKMAAEDFSELKHIILNASQKFILISQSSMISLFNGDMRYFVRTIGVEDLRYNYDEINVYFANNNFNLEEDEIRLLEERTKGWQIFLFYIIQSMRATGLPCGEEVIIQAKRPLYQYLDEKFMEEYTELERDFLLKIGGFKTISLGMIKSITGQANADRIMMDIMQKDSFVSLCAIDEYHFNSNYVKYFIQRRNQYIGEREIERIYRQAGRYYEKLGDDEEAIMCYKQAHDYQSMVDILNDMTDSGVGEGEAYRLRSYYSMIPDEWIKASPNLCAQMVVLSILKWDLESAEKWHKKIQQKCQDNTLEESTKKVWENLYIYLDMTIPLNSPDELIGKAKKYAAMIEDSELTMHRTSFTVNRPSVINGQWDLSIWARKTEEEIDEYGSYFRAIYKEDFAGVLDIIKAEFEYERNHLKNALVHIVSAIYEVESKANMDLLFVAYFIQMKIMVCAGQITTAKPILDNLKSKIEENNAGWLLPNYRAIEISEDLYENRLEEVDYWLENEAPNENTEFYILDCYRYFIKIRIYILNEQYVLGIACIERMRPMCIRFSRHADLMELELLSAAIYNRMDNREEACRHLLEALKLAEKFYYIRQVGDMGPLIYQTMMDLKDSHEGVGDEFFEEVMDIVKMVSERFPFYLKRETKTELSAAETAVLRLMAQAKTNGEIADQLCISVNTVKYHCKNIYLKLDVKNRSNAVAVAIQEKLI